MKSNDLFNYIQWTADKIYGGSYKKDDLTAYGKRARHYYLLLILLINSSVTYEALAPLVNLILKKPYSDERKSISNLYHQAFDKEVTLNGNSFNRPIEIVVDGYKVQSVTVKLSGEGYGYLKYLHDTLLFTKDSGITKEDIDEWYRYSRKLPKSDHALQNTAILAALIANINGISDCVVESGRGDDFVAEKTIRDVEGRFYADISFRSDNNPYTPVIVETDLESERNDVLAEKALKVISYTYNNARRYRAQPGVLLFVVGENERIYSKKKHKQNEGRMEICSKKELSLLSNPLSKAAIRALLGWYRERRINEGMNEELITPHMLIDSMPDLIGNGIGADKLYEVLLAFDSYTAEYHLYDSDIEDALKNMNGLEQKRRIERKEDRGSLFNERVMRKKSSLREKLLSKNMTDMFIEGGEGVYMLSYSELNGGLKSILPNECGKENVEGLLNAVGLPREYTKYLSCRPVLFDDKHNEYVNLRNCFISGGVYVFIEDISYDITALDRIREYLSIPSRMVYNCLLVVIIDDNEIIADGNYLEAVNIYGRHGDSITDEAGRTYRDVWKDTYGTNGILPFKYRKTNDICFVKRSEFIAGKDMHPFVRLGKDVFVGRTKEYMNTDERVIDFLRGGSYRTATRFASDFKRYSFK